MKRAIALIMIMMLMMSMATVALAAEDELSPEELAAQQALQDKNAKITLGILAVAAVLFITEIIPLAITAMAVPVALALTGVVDAKSAFSGLADSNVILFAGMFVVGAALFETGVAKLIGDKVVAIAGTSEIKLTFGVMLVTAVLSSVLSNTGTVAVLLPVCIGIADSAGWSRSKVLMPLAIVASTGGMITMVGTPPNITVNTVLSASNMQTFGFLEYAYVGIPMTIISMIFMLTFGRKLIVDRESVDDSQEVLVEENKTYSKGKQLVAGGILLVVVFIMAFDILPLHIAAVAGALVCVLAGTLTEKQAYASIDWTTIFLFGGMLSLSTALDKTGAGAMIANQVINLLGSEPNRYVLLTVLFFLTAGLTQFMSNTASCALLAPIGLHIATGLGANPHAILMTIGIAASSAFATPVATPPNTLVLGPGGFKFVDYVKVGLPMLVLSYIVSIIVIPIVWPFYG